MDDLFLIRQFNSGNQQAFNTLVWRWQKPVYNFIFRTVGDGDLAKDILQDTFMRVYKGLVHLKEHQCFTAWLFRIATNLCRDEFKKRHRQPQLIDELSATTISESGVPDSQPSHHPSGALPAHEVQSLLHKALQQIPEEQRIVIIMKQLNGLKFSDIAQILDEPLNTIKSRMYYGLSALRKILAQQGLTREDFYYEM